MVLNRHLHSELCYGAATKLLIEIYGETFSEVGHAYYLQGIMYAYQKKWEQAEVSFMKALSVRGKVFATHMTNAFYEQYSLTERRLKQVKKQQSIQKGAYKQFWWEDYGGTYSFVAAEHIPKERS